MSSTGALRGIPPTIFNGERAELQQFLRKFKRYQIQNKGIDLVDNPYKQVVTAMGMMKGKKVNQWVAAQLKKMKERVTAGTLKTNELLWDEFEVAFTKAWTDSTEKQDASHRLQNLKMKGEDLDEYIAEFEELMTIGGWDEKSEATMILFRNGLPKHICNACMFREKMSNTLEKWQETAREEIVRRCAFKVMNEQLGIPFIPKKGQPSTPAKQSKTGFYAPGSDPVPMHVDVTTTQKTERPRKLTDEEREKLRREGRCF